MKQRLTFIFLLMAFFGIIGVNANETASIRVCESPDDSPFVSGNIDMLFERNFKYPAEAWKADRKECVNVDVTVDSKGVVRDAVCTGDVHPALQEEVKRVMMKTVWYPAVKDGHDVAAICKVFIQLRENDLWRNSIFPYGLKTEVKKARDKATAWSKVSSLSEISDEDKREVERMASLFPDYLPVTFNYVGLLNAGGNRKGACELMDSSLKYYQDRYISLDSLAEMHIVAKKDVRRMRPGYNGRSEIAVAIMRALVKEMVGDQSADDAFDDALTLIDNRIVDGDIQAGVSQNEYRAMEWQDKDRARDMWRRLNEKNTHKVPTTDVMDKVFGNYSIDELRMAYYFTSKQGWQHEEMMKQLADKFQQERKKAIQGKYLKRNTLELFGVKAFALWLYKGDEALDKYVAEITEGEGSDKVKEYVIKLQKNLRRHENALGDRDMVMQSVTYLLPEGSKEDGVADLRSCRKTMGRVFPLKWLFKTSE